jgi:enamine deaminase RidA (YjgF/YER057c/UK114 family)
VDRPVSRDGETDTPHLPINPETLPRPVGFSHVMVASPGRTLFVAGQAGHRGKGTLAGSDLVDQFDQAAANVVEALRAADARPEHLTWMQIFVTDAADYRASLKEIGAAYRRHFGRHFPAIGLFEVTGLFDPQAKVELMCVAVVPDGATDTARGR